MSELIEQYIENGVDWKYKTILYDAGEKEYIGSTVDGTGNEIKVYKRINPIYKSIKQAAKDENITEKEVYSKYGTKIFQTTNELKQEFSEEHLIKVHSKVKNINDLQVELNDLENPRVPYRMVFTVDMLHEGWDVLNLFDIVRLYDERKDGTSVSPVTTQEAQLIGRGARYFPFKLNQEIIGAENEQYKRKFDAIPDNPLKVCETLYYHCIDNSKYIYDLQRALEETGFKQINEEVKFEYKLKKDFIESDIYKYGKLFINSYEEKPAAEISKIPDTFTIMSSTNLVKRSSVSKLYERIEEENTIDEKIVERTHKVTKVDKRILLKALRKFPVYEFSRLKSYFPLLKSHSEFLSSNYSVKGLPFYTHNVKEQRFKEYFEKLYKHN